MNELERVRAFEEALREEAAERVVPFRWGRAVFNDSLPLVWELNVVRVDRDGDVTAKALAAEADRLQGDAGLTHRRIAVLDESLGARLERELRELGWRRSRFVFMVHRHGSAKEGDLGRVSELEAAALDPLRDSMIRDEAWGKNDEVVRQIRASNRLIQRAGRARHFGVVENGRPVSCADLYSDGRTAQIEDVVTLADYRGRGFGSAVVLKALHEALETGHDLVFLIADDEDWPKVLYERLGFEPVGRKYAFLKAPA